MKQAIAAIVVICLITACAGRNPRPVDAMKVTDKDIARHKPTGEAGSA